MLYLIGLGLKPKHLTLDALEAIKSCDKLLLETYTSRYSHEKIGELEKIVGKKIEPAGRKRIEEETKNVVESARKMDVGLLVFGNPLTATTHVEFLLEAKRLGVKAIVIEGISVTNALSRTGLDEYRFGRTTTIPMHSKGFEPDSFYGFIEQNSKLGLHTLCLLDTGEGREFMGTKTGLEVIEKIETKESKKKVKDSVIVLASCLGTEKQKIFAGSFEEAKKIDWHDFPQCIVVCGRLTEKEKEALKELHGFES